MTPPWTLGLVSFRKFAVLARFEHVHLVNSSFTKPYTSVGLITRQVRPANSPLAIRQTRVHDVRWRSPRMKAFSPSANGPSDPVDAGIGTMMLVGRTTAFNFVIVRILETMCVPSGLGAMSTVVFFPSKHQSRRDDTLFFSLPDRGCFRWYDRHGLEPSTPFHSVSEIFQNVASPFALNLF